jgi:hypothetical protein
MNLSKRSYAPFAAAAGLTIRFCDEGKAGDEGEEADGNRPPTWRSHLVFLTLRRSAAPGMSGWKRSARYVTIRCQFPDTANGTG